MQEQQARQQEIQTVKEEISKKDQEILSLESQLKEAEKLLVSLNRRCHDDLNMTYFVLSRVCFNTLFVFIHVRCPKM